MDGSQHSTERFEVGKPFRPWRRFNMAPIPDPILRSRELSDGGKVLYAQLARHEGKAGPCKVKAETLAAEIGWSKRKAERHLSELKRLRLIRRKGIAVVFLWHQILENPPDMAVSDELETATFGGAIPPDMAGPSEESFEESATREDSSIHSRGKQSFPDESQDERAVPIPDYPVTALRSCLAEYFGEDPSERTVKAVLEAAGGSETEAVLLLTAKKHRGFARGEPNGPQSWEWFLVTVKNHFARGESWPSDKQPPAPQASFSLDGGQDLSPLRSCLRAWFGKVPGDETLREVLAAGAGATQPDIVALLKSKQGEFPKGHRQGPRHWKWFVSTVRNHFDRAAPASEQPHWRMPPDRVLELASAFDPHSDEGKP